MGHDFIERLRLVRDILVVSLARRREYRGDFAGALSFVEKRKFRSALGQDLSALYRLKLMVVAHEPTALKEARRIAQSPSKLRGAKGFYFRAYSKYLYAIMANDGGRERRAIEELEVIDAGAWVRRILPYFKELEIQSGQ